jgi:hypothetical protein
MTRIRVGLVPGLLLALALAACGGGDGNSGGAASLGGAGGATSTTSVGGRNELRRRSTGPGVCASTASTCPTRS